MSSGHTHKSPLSQKELDDVLDEVLAHKGIKERLARPYKLVTEFDIPLLGSSSVGGLSVYLDRHLRAHGLPYGVIVVGKGRTLDVKPGLVRHERLEQAIEDVLGWQYEHAHHIAQHYEERDYRRKGFDPRAVERAFEPFIHEDDHERITRVPTDLDMRPLLAPPRSSSLITHINQIGQSEKRTHASVGYVAKSTLRAECHRCRHWVAPEYGGSSCTGVQSPISPHGWCRRFARGKLGEINGDRADAA